MGRERDRRITPWLTTAWWKGVRISLSALQTHTCTARRLRSSIPRPEERLRALLESSHFKLCSLSLSFCLSARPSSQCVSSESMFLNEKGKTTISMTQEKATCQKAILWTGKTAALPSCVLPISSLSCHFFFFFYTITIYVTSIILTSAFLPLS